MKKILSLAMALIMAVSLFALPTQAATSTSSGSSASVSTGSLPTCPYFSIFGVEKMACTETLKVSIPKITKNTKSVTIKFGDASIVVPITTTYDAKTNMSTSCAHIKISSITLSKIEPMFSVKNGEVSILVSLVYKGRTRNASTHSAYALSNFESTICFPGGTTKVDASGTISLAAMNLDSDMEALEAGKPYTAVHICTVSSNCSTSISMTYDEIARALKKPLISGSSSTNGVRITYKTTATRHW